MTPDYYTSTTYCSCPAFYYRRSERPCKHIKAYRAARRMVEEQEQHNATVEQTAYREFDEQMRSMAQCRLPV